MPSLHGFGAPGPQNLPDALERRPDQAAAHAEVGARLRTLLERAERQDESSGRLELLRRAVEQLVPDEARILHFLAHQPEYSPGVPLVHIHGLTSTGLAAEPAVENASTVGRLAGVALPSQTPRYVTRLLGFGLVELGPEDERLADEYHGLLADPGVLTAMTRVVQGGGTPRVLRHTLVLTPLGQELCADADAG